VALGFGLLALLVRANPLIELDVQITSAIQSIQSPTFASLMRLISWPGFLPQSAIITFAVAGLVFALGWRWEGLAAAAASLISSGINELVKVLIHRPRPEANLVHVFEKLNSFSFPSGHVMFYLTFFGFFWYLGYTLLKPSPIRTALLTFLALPILLVGPSRIYLGEHWASDVLGAYLLGTLTLTAAILFYHWGRPRFATRQPEQPAKDER
jgi:undecaprenyl-diphosphatase